MASIREAIPPALERLVQRAIAKADDDRFQSAAQMARAVEELANKLYPGRGLQDNAREYLQQQRRAVDRQALKAAKALPQRALPQRAL